MPNRKVAWHQNTPQKRSPGLEIPEIIKMAERTPGFHIVVAHLLYGINEIGAAVRRAGLCYRGGVAVHSGRMVDVGFTLSLIERDYRQYEAWKAEAYKLRHMDPAASSANTVVHLTRHKGNW